MREIAVMLDCDVLKPGFRSVIDLETDLELLADGFLFIEGPVWQLDEGCLFFNDIPVSVAYRWDAVGGVRIFRQDTNKANGNTFDRSGRLLVCEHATSRVVRIDQAGSHPGVIASHYQGLELNSPNDIIVSRDGTIWFTDPRFGRNPSRVGVERPQELSFQGVFRMDPLTGELALAIGDLTNPNGLCLSPDEKTLYVNDSPTDSIYACDVALDGTLTGKRLFAITEGDGAGHPDGLKVDRQGHVYCAAQGGLHVYDPDGTLLGRVRIPAQTANFCFGDADLKSIYVTASDRLYRLRCLIPGTDAGVGRKGGYG